MLRKKKAAPTLSFGRIQQLHTILKRNRRLTDKNSSLVISSIKEAAEGLVWAEKEGGMMSDEYNFLGYFTNILTTKIPEPKITIKSPPPPRSGSQAAASPGRGRTGSVAGRRPSAARNPPTSPTAIADSIALSPRPVLTPTRINSRNTIFVEYYCSRANATRVKCQAFQALSILLMSFRLEESLFYLLSSNYINAILANADLFSSDELAGYFVSLLKTLALRLDAQTIVFLLSGDKKSFPIMTEAVRYYRHPDRMVRISVQTSILALLNIGSDLVIEFFTNYVMVPFLNTVCTHMAELVTPHGDGTDAIDHSDALDVVRDWTEFLADLGSVDVPGITVTIVQLVLLKYAVPAIIAPLASCGPSVLPLLLLGRLVASLDDPAYTPLTTYLIQLAFSTEPVLTFDPGLEILPPLIINQLQMYSATQTANHAPFPLAPNLLTCASSQSPPAMLTGVLLLVFTVQRHQGIDRKVLTECGLAHPDSQTISTADLDGGSFTNDVIVAGQSFVSPWLERALQIAATYATIPLPMALLALKVVAGHVAPPTPSGVVTRLSDTVGLQLSQMAANIAVDLAITCQTAMPVITQDTDTSAIEKLAVQAGILVAGLTDSTFLAMLDIDFTFTPVDKVYLPFFSNTPSSSRRLVRLFSLYIFISRFIGEGEDVPEWTKLSGEEMSAALRGWLLDLGR